MRYDVNWKPLETFAGACGIDPNQYMYMGTVNRGDTDIHLYKHAYTRRYLNLDEKGNAYKYNARTNSYTPTKLEDAKRHVLS